MKFQLPIIVFLAIATALICQAQDGQWEVRGTNPASRSSRTGDTNTFENGAVLSNQTATIYATRGSVNDLNGAMRVEGDVIILDHSHIWRGTNAYYDFKTGEVLAGAFKSVQMPFNMSGEGLKGSNNLYTATNGMITTDDVANPFYKIRARTMTIVPGQYFEAYDATLYLGSTPVFYWPHYKRTFGDHPTNFEFIEGYRSLFGPYLLSAFNWYGLGPIDGTIHFDLREKRGLAGGPDFDAHLGKWGEAVMRYYYADDQEPNADGLSPAHLRQNRQRADLFYQVSPTSNFTAKVVANYQNDPLVVRDFFEHEYRTNVQPATFAEGTQLWNNWTLDAMAQPRTVHFYETVERLPDIKLDGLPQEVGKTPIYYQSESSAGYYRRAFSITNDAMLTNYEAMRADTFHQFTLPETFFGWLNVTPRVGGRLTYYGSVDGPSAHTNDQGREILNTGVDFSWKASRVYKDADSSLLDVHELRHIIQPEFDYVYVDPSRYPSHVPQFDYQQPSLRLLPIEFPEYNSIDSINKMNVVRLMLRNKLQTKRDDGVEDLVNWAIYTDWNLTRGTNASFSDLYNDLTLRPRSWLSLDSSLRYDIPDGRFREAILGIRLQPTTAWSVAFGYYYLENNDPEFQTFPGQTVPGHNLFSASFYYRLNENWAVHVMERFEAQNGAMQEQLYSIYRDMRSWTAALSFRLVSGPGQPTDFGVAFTMSLKAFPRFGLNSDRDNPSLLLDSASGSFDSTIR
jgi:lipopolysaccharide assembly outer membrane protein LptD (OstA)